MFIILLNYWKNKSAVYQENAETNEFYRKYDIIEPNSN